MKQMESVLAKLMGLDHNPPPPKQPPYNTRKRPTTLLSPSCFESLASMNHHLLPSTFEDVSGKGVRRLYPTYDPQFSVADDHFDVPMADGSSWSVDELMISDRNRQMNWKTSVSSTGITRKCRTFSGTKTGVTSFGGRRAIIAKHDLHPPASRSLSTSGSKSSQGIARQITCQVQETVWMKCLHDLKSVPRRGGDDQRPPKNCNSDGSLCYGIPKSPPVSSAGQSTNRTKRCFSVHKDWCFNLGEAGVAEINVDNPRADTEVDYTKAAANSKVDEEDGEETMSSSRSTLTTASLDSEDDVKPEVNTLTPNNDSSKDGGYELPSMELFSSGMIHEIAVEEVEFSVPHESDEVNTLIPNNDPCRDEGKELASTDLFSSGMIHEIAVDKVEFSVPHGSDDQWFRPDLLLEKEGEYALTDSTKHETFGHHHREEHRVEEAVKIEESRDLNYFVNLLSKSGPDLELEGEEESRDFKYFVNVLSESGLDLELEGKLQNQVVVDPLIFEKLEKQYGKEESWLRSERKLMFDQISYKLTELLDPYTQTMLQGSSSTVPQHSRGREEFWRFMVSALNGSTKEEGVLGKERDWVTREDDICVVVEEIERFLFDELVDEFIVGII